MRTHTHPKSAVNRDTTWTCDEVEFIPQRGRHDRKYSKMREHCVVRNAMKANVTELEKMELVRGHGSVHGRSRSLVSPSSQVEAIQGLEHMDSIISFRPWKAASGIMEGTDEVESQLAYKEVKGKCSCSHQKEAKEIHAACQQWSWAQGSALCSF